MSVPYAPPVAAPVEGAGLTLTGTVMEMAGTSGPATVFPDITLTLSAIALTITAAPPSSPASTAWSAVTDASCGEAAFMPDGAPAVAVCAVVHGRFFRWLVPAEQMPPERASAIDHLLGAKTGRPLPDPGGRGEGRRGRSRHRSKILAALGAADPLMAGAEAVAGRAGATPPPRHAPASPVGYGWPDRPRTVSVRVVTVLWALLALLVLAGAVILAAGLASSVAHATSGSRSTSAAASLARSIGLRLDELPLGWTASSTPHGPLSGFVGTDGLGSRSLVPGTADEKTIVAAFDRCLGVTTSKDLVLGTGGPAPEARATSGAYAGPATGPPMQVASITDVYASVATVREAAAEISRSGFAACFGAAVGKEFRLSAQESMPTSGATYGSAHAVALALPKWAGVHAAGVDLVIPIDYDGSSTTVDLGFVFVTGGRVESTLVTYSASAFPDTLSQSLAATLEEGIASHSATDELASA